MQTLQFCSRSLQYHTRLSACQCRSPWILPQLSAAVTKPRCICTLSSASMLEKLATSTKTTQSHNKYQSRQNTTLSTNSIFNTKVYTSNYSNFLVPYGFQIFKHYSSFYSSRYCFINNRVYNSNKQRVNNCCILIPPAHRCSYFCFNNVNCRSLSSSESVLGASKDDEGNDGIDLSEFPVDRIRNFCIIAHIDHGKSTLADRILEMAGVIKSSNDNKQVLDTLQVEKERGITVKAQTVSIVHHYQGQDYLLNLIDTPGHVDFSYEVSRSLGACQGAVLLVDANKGVQAQTVANFYLAFGNDVHVVPALNKIDLPNAQPDVVKQQLLTAFDIEPQEVLQISAKLGIGISELLDAVVSRIPPPEHCDPKLPFRALLYDSWFHPHKGAVCLIAVRDGSVKAGSNIIAASTGLSYTVREVGVHSPRRQPLKELKAGQVGYLMANIRNIREAAVGDTFKSARHKDVETLPGFFPAKPMVYAGVYPAVQKDADALSSAMQKLTLNDSSVTATKESSAALGQGWRVGFLGLLHLDVFLQRLEQEHQAETVTTTPSVPYKVVLKGKKAIKEYGGKDTIIVHNPLLWPDPSVIAETHEPYVTATIITPDVYFPSIVGLCTERRGRQLIVRNLDETRIMATFAMPLAEVVVDFYDVLKSLSSGYATFDYEDRGYLPSSLVKLGILVNGEPVEELCVIVHTSKVRSTGLHIVTKLKESIPHQLYKVAIQAVVGSEVIARENIKAVRKDVTAKCYGGDVTRKMKLLKRQAEGKEKMRRVGNIVIPRKAFIDVLKK